MRKSLFFAALFCIILCNAEAKEPTSYNYQRGVECLQNHDFDEGKKFLQKELQEEMQMYLLAMDSIQILSTR